MKKQSFVQSMKNSDTQDLRTKKDQPWKLVMKAIENKRRQRDEYIRKTLDD